MENLKVYKSNRATQSVETTLNQIESKEKDNSIELSPLYQRSVVWSLDMMMLFILSILEGITSNHIIFNRDTETNHYVCIDGKQRLTSLLKFKNNEYSVNIDNTNYYYSKVPDKYKKEKTYKAMTKKQQNEHFNNRELLIVYYDDLTYEEQAKIFNRIQNSKQATSEEKILSKFKNKQNCELFKSFSNKHKKDIQIFEQNDIDWRDKHYGYILNILFMFHHNMITIFKNTKQEDKFIQELDNLEVNIFKKLLKKSESYIIYIFSNDILKHSTIVDIYLTKPYKICLVYAIYKHFGAIIIKEEIENTMTINLRLSIKQSYEQLDNKDKKKYGVEILNKYITQCMDIYKQLKVEEQVEPEVEQVEEPEEELEEPVIMKVVLGKNKNKKEVIPKRIKQLVWNKYVGEKKGSTKCYCCKVSTIKQMEFHCGHYISEKNGGKATVANLRPMCAPCNLSMGSKNMDEFINKHQLHK